MKRFFLVLFFFITLLLVTAGRNKVMAKNKKAELPFLRQLGFLVKIRSFPPLLHNRFGFIFANRYFIVNVLFFFNNGITNK